MITAAQILSHNFLSPKFLQSKRDSLSLTSKTSKYRAEAEAEVAALEKRAEEEKPARVARDRLLAALKDRGVIASKYGDGYVSKGLNSWNKIELSAALALIGEG